VVGALAMTLGVFGGGHEHEITGSALLAFACGWAVLAVLSIRMTSQPQRWAVVPAVGMAVTGLGLLVLAPGDGAMTASGWVWPPALLALAIWMGFRVRRSLAAGNGRWALYPVVAVMAAAAVGGAVETVSLASDARHAMPGHSYDVGGYELHLNCTGSGGPTVVLQSGLSEMSPYWSHITPAIEDTTRICAYDRAGQGWSEDSPHVPDGVQVAADLHTLLAQAGETGPFVLVGHSTGGAYAMTYAARYPEQVAGLVLLDSASPYQFTVLPEYAKQHEALTRLYGVQPTLTRLGVGRLVPALAANDVPGAAGQHAAAFANTPHSARTARDEVSTFRHSFEQAQALTTLGAKPLVVVSASENLTGTAGWEVAQEQLAALSSNSDRRTVTSSHGGVLDHPTAFNASIAGITDVVEAVRSDSSLTTS
jgi:pimeloyl-ACP methyl ester carboxylesterase